MTLRRYQPDDCFWPDPFRRPSCWSLHLIDASPGYLTRTNDRSSSDDGQSSIVMTYTPLVKSYNRTLESKASFLVPPPLPSSPEQETGEDRREDDDGDDDPYGDLGSLVQPSTATSIVPTSARIPFRRTGGGRIATLGQGRIVRVPIAGHDVVSGQSEERRVVIYGDL